MTQTLGYSLPLCIGVLSGAFLCAPALGQEAVNQNSAQSFPIKSQHALPKAKSGQQKLARRLAGADFQPVGAIRPAQSSEMRSEAGKKALQSDQAETTQSIPPTGQEVGAPYQRSALPKHLTGRWTIDALRMQDNSMEKVEKLLLNPAVITMSDNGKISMTAGCRRNQGTVKLERDQFSVGMLVAEDRFCNEAQEKLEKYICKMLDEVSIWKRQNEKTISLYRSDGQSIMTLSRH
jgi:heat shock protein HslJ